MLNAPIFVGLGFMIAILYIDLQFDMLALPAIRNGEQVPASVLGEISTYYGVITKNPYLLVFVMATTLSCIIAQIMYDLVPAWAGYASLVLMAAAMLVGAGAVIPKAQRLAMPKDSIEVRSQLVKTMFPSHIFLLVLILSLSAVQLIAAVK